MEQCCGAGAWRGLFALISDVEDIEYDLEVLGQAANSNK